MAEQDKLKEFVNQNRNDFDFHEPPNLNFGKVNKEANIKKSDTRLVPLKAVLQIAAVITIIACISGGVYINSLRTKTNVNEIAINESTEDFQLSSVSNEMAETENYYIQQVNIKQKQIENLGFSEDIKDELNLLDEEFNNLKNELGKGFDNEIIIEKMIMNYQLKLDLLEQILSSINTVNDKPLKKEDNENNYTIYY